MYPTTPLQYPFAPGAFSSFLKSRNKVRNFSFPSPPGALPPFAFKSTNLATRSQAVPPAAVSSRFPKYSSASRRALAMALSLFLL